MPVSRVFTVIEVEADRVVLQAQDGARLEERRDALPADVGVGDVLAGAPRTACGECYHVLYSAPGEPA